MVDIFNTKNTCDGNQCSDNPWTKYKTRPIEYVGFSSGSLGGLSLIGCWRALEEKGLALGIRGFSGSSIGAIMSLLMSVGYSSEELTHLCKYLKYKSLADIQLLGLLDNMGLETGNKIVELLSGLLSRKVGKPDLTFREHWNITGRYLCITASCVETGQCEYFSINNEPDMSVLHAVRMSIAIPWLITAVTWRGKTYVDGALYDPCPVLQFPQDKTIAFEIVNDTCISSGLYGFAKHTTSILFGIYKRLYRHHYNEIGASCRVIQIVTGASSMSFIMNRKQRMSTIQSGYEECRKALS